MFKTWKSRHFLLFFIVLKNEFTCLPFFSHDQPSVVGIFWLCLQVVPSQLAYKGGHGLSRPFIFVSILVEVSHWTHSVYCTPAPYSTVDNMIELWLDSQKVCYVKSPFVSYMINKYGKYYKTTTTKFNGCDHNP